MCEEQTHTFFKVNVKTAAFELPLTPPLMAFNKNYEIAAETVGIQRKFLSQTENVYVRKSAQDQFVTVRGVSVLGHCTVKQFNDEFQRQLPVELKINESVSGDESTGETASGVVFEEQLNGKVTIRLLPGYSIKITRRLGECLGFRHGDHISNDSTYKWYQGAVSQPVEHRAQEMPDFSLNYHSIGIFCPMVSSQNLNGEGHQLLDALNIEQNEDIRQCRYDLTFYDFSQNLQWRLLKPGNPTVAHIPLEFRFLTSGGIVNLGGGQLLLRLRTRLAV